MGWGGLSYSSFKHADTLRATRRPAPDLGGFVFSRVAAAAAGGCRMTAVYRRHKLLKNVLAVSCRLGTFLFHGWHAPALPGRGAASPHPPHPTVKHVSPRVWKFAFSIMKCRKQSVRTLTQHRLTFTDICCWGDV